MEILRGHLSPAISVSAIKSFHAFLTWFLTCVALRYSKCRFLLFWSCTQKFGQPISTIVILIQVLVLDILVHLSPSKCSWQFSEKAQHWKFNAFILHVMHPYWCHHSCRSSLPSSTLQCSLGIQLTMEASLITNFCIV